jgi:CSLREA domain-containing protein
LSACQVEHVSRPTYPVEIDLALSARSFRRERERRAVADRRREQRRLRRAGLLAGAAVGAFALSPAAAQAQNFTVNTLTDATADGCTTDPGGCTLRDAMTDASANSEADLITFASGLSGTVTLTEGELATSTTAVDDVEVQGPGAGAITISGDADASGTPNAGDSRIFNVAYVNDSGAAPSTTLTVSGLTLSGGYVAGNGGAVYVGEDNHLTLNGVALNDNKALSGGAIGSEFPKYSEITVTDSTISGNSAISGGGISTNGPLTVDGSTLSDNHATGGGGGAISFGQKYGPLVMTDSTVSGSTAMNVGGGIATYASTFPKYAAADNEISKTTISNNTAGLSGGGVYSNGLRNDSGSLTVDHTTISGNHAGPSAYGGGLEIANTVNGSFQVVDSTISGNTAAGGAGASILTPLAGPQIGPNGSISFDNSSVASNIAANKGGGIYLGDYGPSGGPYTSATIGLESTIVGSNTASGSGSDLDRADASTAGGFDLSFSLVQAPGDGVANQSSSILNQSPQLGGLANNGGPTLTQLPATSSPAIDAGNNPLSLSTDQRGQPRTVDLGPSNTSDGTDIGAVEVGVPPTPSPTPPVTPPAKKKPKCKKKHKKKHKRSAESSKKKHKKCKKKHKKKRH